LGAVQGIATQVLATANNGGLLAKGDYSKLAAETYGQRFDDIGMETGTFDADVSTGQNGDVAARIWSNVNDGEGRWAICQPEKRSGGDVVIRMVCALGTVASGGSDTAKFRLDYGFHDVGEQYPTSMASSVTVTKDLTGIAVRTYFVIDFTILAANWNGSKGIAELHLIRLSNADAADNYTAGSFYQHRLDIGYTAYGGASLPAAPT
jgi:hypothetical protein